MMEKYIGCLFLGAISLALVLNIGYGIIKFLAFWNIASI